MLNFNNMEKQDIFNVDLSDLHTVNIKDYIKEDTILDTIISNYNEQFPIGGDVDQNYEFKISKFQLEWLIQQAKNLQGIKSILEDII